MQLVQAPASEQAAIPARPAPIISPIPAPPHLLLSPNLSHKTKLKVCLSQLPTKRLNAEVKNSKSSCPGKALSWAWHAEWKERKRNGLESMRRTEQWAWPVAGVGTAPGRSAEGAVSIAKASLPQTGVPMAPEAQGALRTEGQRLRDKRSLCINQRVPGDPGRNQGRGSSPLRPKGRGNCSSLSDIWGDCSHNAGCPFPWTVRRKPHLQMPPTQTYRFTGRKGSRLRRTF